MLKNSIKREFWCEGFDICKKLRKAKDWTIIAGDGSHNLVYKVDWIWNQTGKCQLECVKENKATDWNMNVNPLEMSVYYSSWTKRDFFLEVYYSFYLNEVY